MKIIVPDYYEQFHCIASQCTHTCCKGWEVEIDEESMERYAQIPEINEQIEHGEDYHFRLSTGEVCPFLDDRGLCKMILKYGEKMLCQTCTDHPRFRNFWSDRVEMGLGLVCEEAGRLILSRQTPMKLVIMEETSAQPDDEETLDEEEQWLLNLRDEMLLNVKEEGPLARLREYLIYRHIPDALYDDRLEERIAFVDQLVDMAREQWEASDHSLDSLVEILRVLSYDVEYDEDTKEAYLAEGSLNS